MNKRDIFISYSHKDKTMADALCHHFEQEKIHCWIAPRDIVPGVNWAESIAEAIPQCTILLIIFSAHSNMSKQVLREVELAVSSGIMILPVRIEDIAPTGGMKYYLSTVHWIDAVDKNMEKNLVGLSKTVKNLLSGENIPGKSGGKMPVPPKRKMPLWLWFAIGTAALAGILLFVFRTSIFGSGSENHDAAVSEPTATIEITNAPDATEQISLTDPVNIQDDVLRSCIIQALKLQGINVDDEITISDMQKLETLKIISAESREAQKDFKPYEEILIEYFKDGFIVTDEDIASLSGLEYAVNLKILSVEDKSIRDLTPLENLPNIELLYLNNNRITQIDALANLNTITYLAFNDNLIIDITPLENLTALKGLSMNSNLIEDVEPLKKMVNLESLSIEDNNISNISFLSEMRYLKYIMISSNNISDISVLKYFRKVVFVNVMNNNISDISPTASMDDLEMVFMQGCPVNDLSPLIGLENLNSVDISSSIVDDNRDVIDELINSGVNVSVDWVNWEDWS